MGEVKQGASPMSTIVSVGYAPKGTIFTTGDGNKIVIPHSNHILIGILASNRFRDFDSSLVTTVAVQNALQTAYNFGLTADAAGLAAFIDLQIAQQLLTYRI
jgi:hypothetical protein